MRADILDHCARGSEMLLAFADGLRKHGVETEHRVDTWKSDADLVVTWGITGARRNLVKHRKSLGLRTVVIERGYINRDKYHMAGFDGLNGNADFVPHAADPDRAKWILNRVVPARKPGGSYILLAGQVETDSALYGLDYKKWVTETIANLKVVYPDTPVLFRPHPNQRAKWLPKGVAYCRTDLSTAMQNAYGVVTLNSNVGVLSVLDGHPTIAHDKGSMVWLLAETGHTFKQLPNLSYRNKWVVRMASCQWTREEFSNGDAWAHLKQGV